MGEKIRNLGDFKVGSTNVYIELNEGYSKQYSKYDIHIQNDIVQYCLTNAEFMLLASTMINAKEKMTAFKNYFHK